MLFLLLPSAGANVLVDPLSADQRAYVQERGPLTVSIGPTGAPFAYHAPDGDVEGITIDLLRLMEIDLDIRFEPVIYPTFGQAFDAMANGTVDVYGPTLPVAEREQVALYSAPFAWSRFGFWVGPHAPWVTSPADLAGSTVAVPDSTGLLAILANYPEIIPVRVPDMLSAARMVAAGEAVAAFGGTANMAYHTLRPELASLRPLGPPAHVTENVLSVRKDDAMLLSILNVGLSRISEEQRMSVYIKWTGADLGPPMEDRRGSVSAAWWVVGATAGALVMLLASSAILRRQVRARTADLAAEHAKLERIMETSPGGLAVVEPDGSLAYANRRAEELLGLRRDELDPERYVEPSWQITDLDGRPFPAEELPVPSVLRTGHPVHDVRYAIEWEDGHRIPLSVNAAPLMDSHGRVSAVVAAFEDLSAQLAVQEAERVEFLRRIEMERLQEIDRFRREFINAAAHELKNPLTPLSVQLHLLERDARSLAPAHRQSVAILRRNLDRLARLVTDMLDVTRLEAGRMPLEIGRVDMGAIAQEAVGSLAAVAAQKGISITIDADHTTALGDGERLSQVLYNLIGNAVKYTPHGGQIHVRVREEEDAVLAEVEDTGLGLTPQQIEVLFEPFSRVHDAEVPGTGLGLHISRGIAEAHGGTLTCRSPGPGEGSVFTMRLPLQRHSQEPLLVEA